jgi:hypothetical protein
MLCSSPDAAVKIMLKLTKALSKECRTNAHTYFNKLKADTDSSNQLEKLFSRVPSLLPDSVTVEELTLVANTLGTCNVVSPWLPALILAFVAPKKTKQGLSRRSCLPMRRSS